MSRTSRRDLRLKITHIASVQQVCKSRSGIVSYHWALSRSAGFRILTHYRHPDVADVWA